MNNKKNYNFNEKEFKIFDSIPEIIMIFEPLFDEENKIKDLIIRYINSKTILVANISCKEVINKCISEILLIGNIKPYLPLAEEILKNGDKKKFDFYLPSLDSYFRISAFTIFNNLIATLIMDITDDKKNEEELKISKEKIQDILDGIVESYYELDNEWRFVELNKNALMLFGKSKKDLLGKVIWNVFSNSGYSEFYKHYHKAKRENIDVHFEIKSKLDLRWYEIHAYPHPQGLYIYSHDITERKEADEELREAHCNLEILVQKRTNELEKAYKSLKESEEKFREIFNKANDMISLNEMIDNFPGKFIEINDVGIKRLGYTKEELLNMGPPDIVAPEGRPEMPENARNLIKNGCNTFEIVHVTKDGKKIPVEVNNHLINYKGRKVCLAISRDITERKKSEEERENLINELKRSNEELQQFAYITSHDLQEPLRTIASFTQLLEKRYKGKFDSDADEFMNYTVDAAIRMKQMIQDLLEYSRVSTPTEDFKLVNTEEILKNVLFDLKTIIDNNNAKITYDKLPKVEGDKDQLTRVFLNLISNAIKFRKPDESPKIHISCRKEDNEYIFSVQDNGIGIEKDYYNRIFTIFQRLHTLDEFHGSGIGLSISKKIIERHGGRIWVESSFGVGSTFFFTIPIKPTL
ncbi:PAS domain-containing sensor histidine kinase [Methanobacterium oryzae]|uniref:PAS domain-containing sensor histidine kinase n=1 Tax=Methanobacterium oryzae TaxID=69540 RepID=UPI003D19E4DA